jgi:hypothetical protein
MAGTVLGAATGREDAIEGQARGDSTEGRSGSLEGPQAEEEGVTMTIAMVAAALRSFADGAPDGTVRIPASYARRLAEALLQAQDSQPAQVAQPSNHPAFVAGPADAGSHETLQQRAEDLWEEVGGGLCICTISTVGHWCEKCQQRIALIKDALRAASASAPAAPREVGGAAPTSTPLDARGLITEIRAVAIAAGQFSVDVENRELSLQAFEEAARASRWADEMEKILADARAEGRRQAIREMAHLMVTMPAEAFEKWLESRLAASPASALGTGEKRWQ